MTEQRIQEKDRLLTLLGYVFAPLRDLVYGRMSTDEIGHVAARLHPDISELRNQVYSFGRIDGAVYQPVEKAVIGVPAEFLSSFVCAIFGSRPVAITAIQTECMS